MKNRRIIALLMALAMLVCITGCASNSEDAEQGDKTAKIVIPEEFSLTALDQLVVDTSKDAGRDPYDIGVMFVDMANEYYVTTAKGCEERCAERNCNYTITSSNNTSSEDIRLIENYINSGVDAVICCYYSAEATEDISKACMEAGIPLICYCFGNTYHTSEIVSDNYVEGEMIAEMAADYVAKNLADKEEIKVAFGTISSVESMATRCDGMVTKFLELVPNAVDVGITEDLNSTAKAYDWAEKVLLAEPDVDVFVCFCDAIAIGVSEAMKDASFKDNMLTHHKHVNMGLAVAKGDGLIVPNVKSADTKSLAQIAQETEALIEATRDGKIAMEDMTGGTFTISSLGAFGVRNFSPIINQPELAILGVCDMVDTPVVFNGEIVIRPMMNLCLTADHRVVDGVQACKFMQRIVELLENPYLLLA